MKLRRKRKPPKDQFPYTWSRKLRPSGRKDQLCKIVGKGKAPGIVLVEFRDGQRFYVDKAGLAKR